MKPRKPDRFARTVNQFVKSDTDSGYDALLFPDDAIYLLRNEHAWMRRMVKAIQKMHIEHMDEWIVLDSVLKQLAQRRK